jgi:hypothetical protein
MMNDGTPRAAIQGHLLQRRNLDDEGAADAPVTADAMFAKAIELAGDDEALLGLIEDAQAEGSRGRIGGAVRMAVAPAGRPDRCLGRSRSTAIPMPSRDRRRRRRRTWTWR